MNYETGESVSCYLSGGYFRVLYCFVYTGYFAKDINQWVFDRNVKSDDD